MKKTFSYRKYGKNLCSVALGLIVIGTVGLGMVRADETKNDSSAKSSVSAKTDQKDTESSKADDKKAKSKKADKFKDLEKTKIEIEKVKKEAPKVKNPNPDPTDPKQDEFKPELKKTEATVEAAKEKSGSSSVEFTAKSTTTTDTQKTSTKKPMTFVDAIDMSGSLSLIEMKQKGYTGPINIRLEQLKNIREAVSSQLDDQDESYLAFYTGNYAESYGVEGGSVSSGAITRKLKKAEALALLDKLIANELEIRSELPDTPGSVKALDYPNGDAVVRAIEKEFSDYFYKPAKGEKKGFEEIIDQDRTKSNVLAVLQFTDWWYDNEVMDKTFADWAKTNARTFMTVIDRAYIPKDPKGQVETNQKPENSENQMKALGHPNIYIRKEINDKTKKEIIDQFQNTAIEKVTTTTKTTKQKGVVSVVASEGLTLTAVKMTGPDGKVTELPIKDGKAIFSEELVDGQYTASYEFKGEGSVTATVTLDGKEVAKKTDSLKNEGGDVKADFRTADGKEIPGQSDLIIAEAGKEIGSEWQAPEVQKELTVDGDTYVLTGAPQESTGKVTKDTVTLHYLYEKKPADKKVYSLTFKVLNVLTDEQIDQDFLVAKGFSGDAYEIQPPTVEGYEVTLKEGAEKGSFAEADILLTYLAHEKGEEVKASFVNEKGEEVKKPEIITKAGELVGKEWTFERDVETEITVKDTTYVLKAVPEKFEGKVSADKQTLKFVYKEKEKPAEPKKPEEKPAEPKKEEPKTLPKTSAVKAASHAE